MRIQVVSEYLNLAEEGLVPRIECPVDQGLLFCNVDSDENIYFYCLSCSYKNYLGLEVYDKLERMVRGI
jgi:hypothetical protein